MSTLREQLPCPTCGQTSYSWGRVFPQSLQFVAVSDASFKDKVSSLMLKKIPARLCNSCGNIQMFSEDLPRND